MLTAKLHLQIAEGAPYQLLLNRKDIRALGHAAFKALVDRRAFVIPGGLSAVARAALQVMRAVPSLPSSVRRLNKAATSSTGSCSACMEDVQLRLPMPICMPCATVQAEEGGVVLRANALVAHARQELLRGLDLTNSKLHREWGAFLPALAFCLQVRRPSLWASALARMIQQMLAHKMALADRGDCTVAHRCASVRLTWAVHWCSSSRCAAWASSTSYLCTISTSHSSPSRARASPTWCSTTASSDPASDERITSFGDAWGALFSLDKCAAPA